MAAELPRHADVVVIGGGIIGCSLAYHLTRQGCTNVVVLERKQLTSGTTWHAAGLVGQLRPSFRMTQLAKYTAELYRGLEAETGQATGFKQNGSVSLATNEGRFEELRRNASMAKVFGLRVDVLTPGDVEALYPLVSVDDVVGAVHIPSDGQANPIDLTQALAKGARMRGARFFEHVKVTRLIREGQAIRAVETTDGTVHADRVVLCTGMWTRDLAASVGVHVPLHACEHFYVVTDEVAGVGSKLPVLRDYDACTYYKEDAGKLLLGIFEPNAKPWGMDGIPEDFCFDELPDDFEHFEPFLQTAMRRIPALADTGIRKFFCGPESFTPDNRYYLGKAPGLSNCFVAAGLNSIGIQSAGGIGKVLSEWIVEGAPPPDLWEVDLRRGMPFESNRRFLRERVRESLGLLYGMHWPFRQYETARGVRRSPFHDRLAAMGACFGTAFGWERPNWFAPPGTAPVYRYSFGRQNWFEHSAAEHRAVRENVGLLDLSSFAKFRLNGADAARVLDRVCTNEVDVAPGRIVYTPCLNEKGTLEAEITVVRRAADDYLIFTAGEFQVRDHEWLRSHLTPDDRASLTDVTSGYAILAVMGPRSRELLQALTPADLSNAAFPFGASREIELGYAYVLASRITYVGELGWELCIPTEYAAGVFDAVVEQGRGFGLVGVGMHAMNSLRIEKGYCHYGHDISDTDTPAEAGLLFAVRRDKAGGFVGRDALERQLKDGIRKRLVQFVLEDPSPLLYHNEPIWRDDAIVGYVRSGMYGHTLGAAVGLGYVARDALVDDRYVMAGRYEIEIAGTRYAARPSLAPLYDPGNERIRS
ncbi:MAG: FAD-dependent oxidoreductase [Vicinamibacterales bacterium]